MVFGKQDNNEGSVVSCSGGLVLGAGGCALRGLEDKITLTLQRYVNLDAQEKWTGFT